MKTKVNLKAKRISETGKRIGTTLLALAMITGVCTPAITSFTQAQPVTKTKKKAKAKKKTKAKKTKSKKKKSYKAKAGTISLSPITLTEGKSKTVSVKTKSKVKWTSSNAKVATVKSISKSKVKVTAKKEGSTKVSGKAGKAKWSFTVKVKGKKPIVKPTGKNTKSKANAVKKKTNESQKNKSKFDIIFCGNYYGALDDNDTTQFNGTVNEDFIKACSSQYKRIKFTNMSPDTIKIKSIDYIEPTSCYADIPGKGTASCAIIPLKAGKAAVKVSYPGGEKIYNITVKETNYYQVAKNVITKVKASGLDDAHKAFVLAKWIEARATYDNDAEWGGISKLIIEGKGVCQGYTDTMSWLLDTVGITNRRVATWEHTWNQIKINGKWYNIDVTLDDSCNEDSEDFSSSFFMKSDGYTEAPDSANPQIGPYQPFNEASHEINKREGYEKGKDYELANGTDYDSYNWLPFYQSDQFKALIS